MSILQEAIKQLNPFKHKNELVADIVNLLSALPDVALADKENRVLAPVRHWVSSLLTSLHGEPQAQEDADFLWALRYTIYALNEFSSAKSKLKRHFNATNEQLASLYQRPDAQEILEKVEALSEKTLHEINEFLQKNQDIKLSELLRMDPVSRAQIITASDEVFKALLNEFKVWAPRSSSFERICVVAELLTRANISLDTLLALKKPVRTALLKHVGNVAQLIEEAKVSIENLIQINPSILTQLLPRTVEFLQELQTMQAGLGSRLESEGEIRATLSLDDAHLRVSITAQTCVLFSAESSKASSSASACVLL